MIEFSSIDPSENNEKIRDEENRNRRDEKKFLEEESRQWPGVLNGLMSLKNAGNDCLTPFSTYSIIIKDNIFLSVKKNENRCSPTIIFFGAEKQNLTHGDLLLHGTISSVFQFS